MTTITGTWTCPDCGGGECDESCPSALAAEIADFESDMAEWEHLTPAETQAARAFLSRRAAA